ncbi:hypothetical protein BGHDH14_bgh02389 [Blumeria hordei DH14]|uniref:Uncharacterized protein n=1 Tax=Blumeria graminis f. sp. hordei (strain DH14) TaxID=546991 RepID=N1J722_BLUG1|nr:hypothetical protein BGHDH14_bgh02389 [Blumeria hordei DH14]
MNNLNVSATLHLFRIAVRPNLCLAQATIPTFNQLPIPLNAAFSEPAATPDIRAVVLDKDNCFAIPHSSSVYQPYEVKLTETQTKFAELKAAYPGRCLLIVSNTAGAMSYDTSSQLASEVEAATGVSVLRHQTKKPGCGAEIMAYFRQHPETRVDRPEQIAVVGDRLTTDVMLANTMGSYGVWVREGIVGKEERSVVRSILNPHPASKLELMAGPASSLRALSIPWRPFS